MEEPNPFAKSVKTEVTTDDVDSGNTRSGSPPEDARRVRPRVDDSTPPSPATTSSLATLDSADSTTTPSPSGKRNDGCPKLGPPSPCKVPKSKRSCLQCGVVGPKYTTFATCNGCYQFVKRHKDEFPEHTHQFHFGTLPRYCSKDCQKAQWKTHKHSCGLYRDAPLPDDHHWETGRDE